MLYQKACHCRTCLEAYSQDPHLFDICTYFLQLTIIFMMLSLRAVATVIWYKNVWTMIAKFKYVCSMVWVYVIH